jgi:hypothetical protein
MATDTPNFNWPIPEDTDLVKDGAKAIRDLGNAIDTSAQDFGGGLVHIETLSFSGVTAQSFNNVFSSTYDNYRIIFNGSSNNNTDTFILRLRASGSDNTTSNYNRARILSEGSSLDSFRVTGATSFSFFILRPEKSVFDWVLYNPFAADRTGFDGSQLSRFATTDTNKSNHYGGHNSTTVFDGFSLIVTGSGITFGGTISIYGYAKV